MKYLIAVDLDGTLLDDCAHLNEESVDYLKNLNKDEYGIVITTGRPYLSMIDFYKKLNLDSLAICNNGATIIKPNDMSFKQIDHNIDKLEFINLFKDIKKYLVSAIYNKGEKCFTFQRLDNSEFLKHMVKNSIVIDGPYDETCEIPPSGMLAIIKPGLEKEFIKEIEKHPNLGCRSWGNFYGTDFYEIYQHDFNKATSLVEVLDYYKLTVDNLITFGDSINDYEMIEMTEYGVAMKNSNEKLLQKAKHITDYDNNHNGVIKYLQKLLKKG